MKREKAAVANVLYNNQLYEYSNMIGAPFAGAQSSDSDKLSYFFAVSFLAKHYRDHAYDK